MRILQYKGVLIALSLSFVLSACLFSKGDEAVPDQPKLKPSETTSLFGQSVDEEPSHFIGEELPGDSAMSIPGVYDPEVAAKIMAEIAKQGVINE